MSLLPFNERLAYHKVDGTLLRKILVHLMMDFAALGNVNGIF